jgi:EmrB/QacA subfamily drug resistance transporter
MSSSRRWWALGALMICVLTLGLDGTILNVALPTLATEIGAGTSGLQWIVDAYILVFAGLLLPMGALGDRLGRKRVLLAGLAFFLVASVGAAYVTGPGPLIVARALMGLGSAIMTPMAMATLPVIFAPEQRARAISVMAAAMGLGVPLGPIVGGWLLDHFWWGSIFLVNVPVAVIGLIAAALFIPESRDARSLPVDLIGGVLSTAGLVGAVYGVIEAPRRGWTDSHVVVALAVGLALLVAFGIWERRCPYPMIDLGLFRRPRFLWGTVAATVGTFGLFGLLFTMPQYFQAVQGADAFATGLRLLPLMGGLVLGAGGADRIVARIGTRIPVTVGLVVIAAALTAGATTALGTSYGFAAGWLATVGFGVGLALAPSMDAVLGELPPEQAGSGTALTMTLRQVGGALGIALLGSVLASAFTARYIGPGSESVAAAVAVAMRQHSPELLASAQGAYVHAMDVVLLVCAGVCLLCAVGVAVALPARPTDREAESRHDLARAA